MNKYIVFFIIFTSFNVFGAASDSNSNQTVDNSDQIKILYELSEKHIKNNDYKKSLKILKALTKREDLGNFRADIYNLLGFSYRKIDNPNLDKSFAAYMMAIEINPEHLGAHEYLGELYLMMGNKIKAKDMLQALKKLAGNNTKEYLELKLAIDNF